MYVDETLRFGMFPNIDWMKTSGKSKRKGEDDKIVSNHIGDGCYTRPELCEEAGFTIYFTMNGMLIRFTFSLV